MEAIYELVKSVQSEKRFKHTLGVVETAKLIASYYDLDEEKCQLAALLHDVSKEFSAAKQQQLLENVSDEFILENKPLWHGFTGANYIVDNLAIIDTDIINSVKYHTIGIRTNNPYVMAIYISDYLEPNRKYSDELSFFRDMLGIVTLERLYNYVVIARVEYEIAQNHQLHPLTKELYESITQPTSAL